MSRPKRGQEERNGPPVMERYQSFCYRVLGRKLEERKDDELAERLRRANVKMTTGMFLSVTYVSTIIAASATAAMSIILFLALLGMDIWFLYVLFLTAMAGVASFVFLSLSVSTKISNRKVKIDRELPFSLSEMSILASTGLSPVQMIRKMAERCKDETMAQEFRKIVYKADVEGKDIVSALGETARESPSERFRETMWDLANMIHQGGDLDQYLRMKADEIMTLKREIQKEFVEKLMGMSEMFTSLVLVGVLMIGIAAFLLDALGSGNGALGSEELLIALAFIIIPVSSFAFIMIISSSYSKTE
ncbi:MAG: type II secretion system F family protein [Methanomassiliicoccales archaeon]|jgi:flagellar protein FlaJ